jgi:hypothetical protein
MIEAFRGPPESFALSGPCRDPPGASFGFNGKFFRYDRLYHINESGPSIVPSRK